MFERAVCILNPAAGRGTAPRRWAAAEPVLRSGGIATEVVATRAAGHATELAAEAAREGCPLVIAIGGDGTVQEVANGLVSAPVGGKADGADPAPALGIIPAGSGNDFVKRLDLPVGDAAAVARALLDGAPWVVDAGRVGERLFVNGVGIGFDARVASEAMAIRRLRGTARYGWALLRVLRSHRPWPMRVVADGAEAAAGSVSMVTATNGPCHGGGFWLCPDARIDDGLLDLLTIERAGRLAMLDVLRRALRGRHLGRPGVAVRRARRVTIESAEPLPVHADGEIIGHGLHRVDIEILPDCLTVLRPVDRAGRR